MKQEIKNIIFFYPSRITGGTEHLFLRYARYLSEFQDKYCINYVDYADGFARKQLSETKVRFIDYSDNERVNIPDYSVVIFQLNRISDFIEVVNYNVSNTCFIFWCLHFKNLIRKVKLKSFRLLSSNNLRIIGSKIDYLSDKGVIKYLGYGAYIEIAKDFYAHPHKVPFIPIVVPTEECSTLSKSVYTINDVVRFCWLGRLDGEKSRNIITYMNELDIIHESRPVSMSLIGDGPFREMLTIEAEKHNYAISFVGEKRDKDLDKYIRSSVDIGLGSGTSALEFAMREVPVIFQGLLPHVYDAGVYNRYVNLHEKKIDYKSTQVFKYLNEGVFKDKVESIIKNYDIACVSSHKHAMQYSLEQGSEKLLYAVESLSADYNDDVHRELMVCAKMLRQSEKRGDLIKKLVRILSFGRISV